MINSLNYLNYGRIRNILQNSFATLRHRAQIYMLCENLVFVQTSHEIFRIVTYNLSFRS